MNWSHIFSGELQFISLVSVLSDAILTLLLSFFFQNGQSFGVTIVFCCCLILLFVLTRFLDITIFHQSNASFFTPLSYLPWRLSFRSYNNVFEKYLIFWVFQSVAHLVDNYAKIVDERGRNLIGNRTLPSLLVSTAVKRCLRQLYYTVAFLHIVLFISLPIFVRSFFRLTI